MIRVPRDVAARIDNLVGTFPEIEEIWLFGSHAERTATAASDWDLMVFSGDRLAPERVAPMRRFSPERYDLFFVVGDRFARPWPRKKDGVAKEGSLTRWKWIKTTADRTTYCANADPDKPERSSGRKPAIRIWTRVEGWSKANATLV